MVRSSEIAEPTINKQMIENILLQYFNVIRNYIIDDEGLVTVKGHCRLKEQCDRLPIRFRKTGGFVCYKRGLVTLDGCPKATAGFSCGENKLTNFIGAPNYVYGDFMALDNPLESLEGLPDTITGTIWLPHLPNLPLLRLVGRDSSLIFKANGDYNNDLSNILTKYSGEASRSNILKCQKELIDAGFVGNAAW